MILKSQPEAAAYFGVRTRTLQYWIQNGMPVNSDGTYDVEVIKAWRAQDERRQKKEKSPDDPEVRFRTAKARLAEIELAKRMGDLLPREEVESEWLNIIITLKKSLLGLPKRLAPQLVGLDAKLIQTALNKHIRELLENLTRNKKV